MRGDYLEEQGSLPADRLAAVGPGQTETAARHEPVIPMLYGPEDAPDADQVAEFRRCDEQDRRRKRRATQPS
jgi:hypothetical protein